MAREEAWFSVACRKCRVFASVRRRPTPLVEFETGMSVYCHHPPIEHCPDFASQIEKQLKLPFFDGKAWRSG